MVLVLTLSMLIYKQSIVNILVVKLCIYLSMGNNVCSFQKMAFSEGQEGRKRHKIEVKCVSSSGI